jgi:primosomal protein N' (replication factor Y)
MTEYREPSALGRSSAALWKVAVDAPMPTALTYRISNDLQADPLLKRGQAVRVPLGRRQTTGVLLGPTNDPGEFAGKLKNILQIDADRPLLPEPFLRWLEWLAQYYLYPVGQVVELAFPPLAKSVKERKSSRAPVTPELVQVEAPKLTDEQAATVAAIELVPGFGAHLVYGVTGSGKTEIYMRLLEKVVAEGKQGLVLVPEISLTPQLIDRFSARFGSAVAVIHSHLTAREKTNQWWAMNQNQKQVLIGARSALFCPTENLGMIVVDEEHEASFKQDEKLKYNARDAAIMLGKFSNCPVILGSATPSLETWSNAQSGRFHLHELKFRVAGRALPTIEVVDMRGEREERKIKEIVTETPFWMSRQLREALEETYAKGRQSALFLNRRGMAQSVLCGLCGHVPECPNCAVSLTLHGRNHLLCHYCDYHETMKTHCSECREGEPKAMGLGTELIEKDMHRLFPSARLIRMDRDEINSREDLETAIKEIENREIDFIIGTQMIAKGLDFPGLTLVGLVMADVAFNLPDFRASERSFQLLTQVSGRSGRHLDNEAGKVIVQTYNPDHPSILFAQAHDYRGFAKLELGFREQLNYPPTWRLAAFRIQGLDSDKVQDTATDLRDRARSLKKQNPAFTPIEILGPAQAPLAKLRGQYRHQLLLKGPDAGHLGRFCRMLLQDSARWVPAAVKVAVDVDAFHLL